jgi:phage baseplate assembly protein W
MPRGAGLVLPFQRDGRGDFANARDDALTASALELILTTEGDSPLQIGELPWRSRFGASLNRLRFLPNSQTTAETARALIRSAVRAWLPDVEIVDVRTSRRGDELRLAIAWRSTSGGALKVETLIL